MDDRVKKSVKKSVLALRKLLEKEDIPAILKQYGIFSDGRKVPLDKLSILDEQGKRRRLRLEVAIDREIHASKADEQLGIKRYCREVAFTYINRLIALRSMEVRGLIEECIKVRQEYSGRSLRHYRFIREFPESRFDHDDEDGLKAFLFSLFQELHDDIKILFDPLDEYSIVMPSYQALQESLRILNNDIPEEAFKEPELLGWVYQYFQAEEKDRVFEDVRTKKKKIQGDDIIPATSLYTERYMVDFLVQNSLGVLWMEMYPDSKLYEKWPYFVKDQDLKKREPRPVKSITFLDPACGSGHFLLVAFDLFAQMYEEERKMASEGRVPPDWSVPQEDVALTIIESNLYGIDIDLRSIQIAYLVLYLKMREHQIAAGASKKIPKKVNLIAADAVLLNTLEFALWSEEQFKNEPYVLNILKGIAGKLANLSEIGSLARPEEELKELIRKEKERLLASWKKVQIPEQKLLFKELMTSAQQELPFEKVTDEEFWAGVMNKVLHSLDDFYKKAAEQGDMRAQVLAHEADRGFKFLELCNKKYDVVATNPPYMGSKNMGQELKSFVQKFYPEGKRDLYAAFILRNLDWTKERGFVAMVTQQSWMFLRSFVKMREFILKETCIQTLPHLGEHAFSDPGAAGAFVVLFTLANKKPEEEHRLVAFRLIEPSSSVDKIVSLNNVLRIQAADGKFDLSQLNLKRIPSSPFVYWLKPNFFKLLESGKRMAGIADVKQGLATGDNLRFVRFWWEVLPENEGKVVNGKAISGKWFSYEKAGGYRKWWGYHFYLVDFSRSAINYYVRYGRFQNQEYFFRKGLTYTLMARGKMGCRFIDKSIYDVASISIFPNEHQSDRFIASILNCRVSTYLMRAIVQDLKFHLGYTELLPVPTQCSSLLAELGEACFRNKRHIVDLDLSEHDFDRSNILQNDKQFKFTYNNYISKLDMLCAALHTFEGVIEKEYMRVSGLHLDDIKPMQKDLGVPAGWFPLISGYDSIPETDVCEIPGEVTEYLRRHERIDPSENELLKIKNKLRTLYEAGPGTKTEELENDEEGEAQSEEEEEEDETIIGEKIPIPTETFLEELSVKMKIHPISIYWLLKELREEDGVICWPEYKRYAEDYFTVLILRLLGFRWPKQIEAGEPVPDWGDPDGIIPITEHTGEKTLLERLRDRLAEQFGEDKVSDIEAEFSDILFNAACKEAQLKKKKPPKKRTTIGEWLEKEFFKRHISQFKKRPIAWHLTSSNGSFQLLLFCQKVSLDMLKSIKNRYLAKTQSYCFALKERARLEEPLPEALSRGRLEAILEELEEFQEKIDQLIKMPYEPLIDDGVRVNIAPFQKLGLLTSPVLAPKDVDRAIADRNRWREDDKEQHYSWQI